MNAVTKAIHDLLTADATLVALLGKMNGMPSVFSAAPVESPDASDDEKRLAFPMVVNQGPTADDPFNTKTSAGRDMSLDIAAYSIDDGSIKDIDTIAERLRVLLVPDLAVSGFKTILQDVSGPTLADGDIVHGRIISVRLILEET